MFCYATGNDVDWYQELGFQAFKLACPYGPADGLDGIKRNEEFVAQAREQIGDDGELMLDCWMAFDVEYTVRLAEVLRPYRLKWMEECLIPEDFDAHIALRQRLPGKPWPPASTGTPTCRSSGPPVTGSVDILQPDINWCGGVSTCRKIAASGRRGRDVAVMLHGGGNTVFGPALQLRHAQRALVRVLRRLRSGHPARKRLGPARPGRAQDGWLVPSDAPASGWRFKKNGWCRLTLNPTNPEYMPSFAGINAGEPGVNPLDPRHECRG